MLSRVVHMVRIPHHHRHSEKQTTPVQQTNSMPPIDMEINEPMIGGRLSTPDSGQLVRPKLTSALLQKGQIITIVIIYLW